MFSKFQLGVLVLYAFTGFRSLQYVHSFFTGSLTCSFSFCLFFFSFVLLFCFFSSDFIFSFILNLFLFYFMSFFTYVPSFFVHLYTYVCNCTRSFCFTIFFSRTIKVNCCTYYDFSSLVLHMEFKFIASYRISIQ